MNPALFYSSNSTVTRSLRRAPSYAQIAQLPSPQGQGNQIQAFDLGGATMTTRNTPRQSYRPGPQPLFQSESRLPLHSILNMRRQSPPACISPSVLSKENIKTAGKSRGPNRGDNTVAGWLQQPRVAGQRSGFVGNDSLSPGALQTVQSPTRSADEYSFNSSGRRSKREIMSSSSEHTCSCGAGLKSAGDLK